MYTTFDNIKTLHAFTTRHGGVSRGVYGALNLGVNRGDDPANVRENYRIIGDKLGIDISKLVFSKQVHEDCVRVVTAADSLGNIENPVPYEADGLVTSEKNLPLIIFTADCIPILLHDPKAGVIGAVHAGWRSTVLDIAGKAVGKMVTELGASPQDIRAAIGPGIGSCCFETGSEVPEAVNQLMGGDAQQFIEPHGRKFKVDLKGINKKLLTRAGVCEENIEVSEECTHCLSEKYWSHRKTGGVRGSQASIIMLRI